MAKPADLDVAVLCSRGARGPTRRAPRRARSARARPRRTASSRPSGRAQMSGVARRPVGAETLEEELAVRPPRDARGVAEVRLDRDPIVAARASARRPSLRSIAKHLDARVRSGLPGSSADAPRRRRARRRRARGCASAARRRSRSPTPFRRRSRRRRNRARWKREIAGGLGSREPSQRPSTGTKSSRPPAQASCANERAVGPRRARRARERSSPRSGPRRRTSEHATSRPRRAVELEPEAAVRRRPRVEDVVVMRRLRSRDDAPVTRRRDPRA